MAGGRTECFWFGPSSAQCPAACASTSCLLLFLGRAERCSWGWWFCRDLPGQLPLPWLSGSVDLLLSEALQITSGKDQGWNLMDLRRHFPIGVEWWPQGLLSLG